MVIVRHNLLANVESGAYTVNPPLDIHQNDANSHILIIKLINNDGKPIDIGTDNKVDIVFYYADTEDMILSDNVKIVNSYRGTLAYKIGPSILRTPARLTAYLRLYNDEQEECKSLATISFVLNVSKVHAYDTDVSEVTLTTEEYERIMAHIAPDMDLHLYPEDRDFLNEFVIRSDELRDLLDSPIVDALRWHEF